MNSYVLLKDQFFIAADGICPCVNALLLTEDQIMTSGSLTTVVRTITNIGDAPISFIPCISVKTENFVADWFVPSVSYSGNAFGDGMEPKGLLCEGKPWIFPSDHAGVPGCTVVMGEMGCSALFLPTDCVSSASSLEICGNAVIQRAFFTHIEYPKAYLEKHRCGDAILETVTLLPGEQKILRQGKSPLIFITIIICLIMPPQVLRSILTVSIRKARVPFFARHSCWNA